MRGRTYLDWNATTPLRGEARAAMAAAFDIFGNPSSVHSEGRAARALMEEARAAVAAAVGADARNVVFTSGGTEANTLALAPGLRKAGGESALRLIVSAIGASLRAGRRPFRAWRDPVLPVRPSAWWTLMRSRRFWRRHPRRWCRSCWPTTRPARSGRSRGGGAGA